MSQWATRDDTERLIRFPVAEVSTRQLAIALYEIGAVRFGEFALKDGRLSPFYLDLRLLISHPPVLRLAAQLLASIARTLTFDRIAGIPYAGLPLAVALALEMNRPMVFARKEAKTYGTKQLVEGDFRAGERALVIDDVITSGTAKIEAFAPLRDAGLRISDVAVVIRREQRGVELLAQAGVRLHAVLSAEDLFGHLRAEALIGESALARALEFIAHGC